MSVRRLAAAALLLSSAVAAAAPSVPLRRATRPLVEVTRGEETWRHEEGIAADDAGAIHAFLGRLGESSPVIVRVPERRGLFLASDFCGGTGTSVGRCLFLLEVTRGDVRELARTRGAGDAYRLTPVAFAGAGRVVVLAELGTESSWGVRVYEIEGAALRDLGAIDAGVPGELGEEDPTPFARVRLEGGRVVVRFETDLVLGTRREGAPIAKRPVTFRQDAEGFVRVPGPAKARPSR